ncbi:hypothetical protein BH23THE1_BH23THE1_17610 [soil metagenome]
MNIIKTEIPFIVEARTAGCHEKKNRSITYHFIESAHSLCMDKEEVLNSQIRSCDRLLDNPERQGDLDIIHNEITKLNLALDAVQK